MKLLNKLVFALLAISLLFTPLASAFTFTAFAEHDEDEPATELVIEEVEYDPIPVILAMRDIEVLLVRMGGVLDNYDGTGHPDNCEDYEFYYILTLLINFVIELETIFAPSEWEDIYTIAADGVNKTLTSNEAVFFLCQNGKNDSLSSFNQAAARSGIDSGLVAIRTAISVSAERAGVDPATLVSDIGLFIDDAASPAELAELAELTNAEWEAELFYEDLFITQTVLDNVGGWLDRLIAGETVGCGEYYIYFELLLEPVPFISVPAEWDPLYREHIAIIRSYIDSNKELLEVCVNGGFITEFMVFKARAGVAQANDRLHALKQETARRLGVTPR